MVEISIVIPTFNRCAQLKECIESILNQDYNNYEIIIIDDGSTDGTKEMLKDYSNRYQDKIILLKQNREGPAKARNESLTFAKGKIVLFIDDDARAAPNWIGHIIEDFKYPKIGIIGGETVEEKYSKSGVLYHRKINTLDFDFVPTKNAAFLKEALKKVNGFDGRFKYPAFEDMDLCVRIRNMGYDIKINNKAVVYHNERHSLKGRLIKQYEYGYGTSTFLDLHPDYRQSCFYYYFITFLLILKDIRQFIKNYKNEKGNINIFIIFRITIAASLSRIFYTLGQLHYIVKNKKYNLLFRKMKSI